MIVLNSITAKKFSVTFPSKKFRKGARSFYELAKKHIAKGKQTDFNLSENIDKVLHEAYSIRN